MNGNLTFLRRTGLLLGGLALTTGVASAQAQESAAQQNDTTMQQAAIVQDSARQDSTVWGTSANRNPDVQNPPGYRGMERPVNVFPPDTSSETDSLTDDATTRVSQMQRQDSAGSPDKNPPGYRGMERPVGSDTATVQREELTGQEARADQTDKKKQVTDTAYRKAKANKKETAPGKAAGASVERRDSVDIIHRERQPAPGVGHEPPPYTPDSQRVWVEQRPEGDSVQVDQSNSSQ